MLNSIYICACPICALLNLVNNRFSTPRVKHQRIGDASSLNNFPVCHKPTNNYFLNSEHDISDLINGCYKIMPTKLIQNDVSKQNITLSILNVFKFLSSVVIKGL